MNKEELRALYRQIRLRMSRGEVSSKSRLIGRKLLNEINWSEHDLICLYQSIEKLNEVDTSGVIFRLKAQRKTLHVLDPGHRAEPPSESFDLIIVPCLAFDEAKHRLGWGGGWYDKFLAGQPQALKVGLAYQDCLVEGNLPDEPHDIALDMIITEERVY